VRRTEDHQEFSDLESASETTKSNALDESTSTPSDPETDSAETASSQDEDGNEESYSKRVQKRINKLTAKTRQLEQETNFWKDRVSALEAKTAAKEFSDFQNQVAYSEQQLQGTYQNAQTAYRKAKEEGDIEAELKAQEQMLDLRDQIIEKRRLSAAAKEQADKLQPVNQPSREVSDPTPANLPDGTKTWLKSNPWFMKGSDPKAAQYARQLDVDLQEEGFSPDDPAMYAELDKRLRVLVPRLKSASPSVPAPNKAQARARVAGSSADGQRTDSNPAKPKRTLTHSDLDAMRRYGMNPNQAKDRTAWIRRNEPLI